MGWISWLCPGINVKRWLLVFTLGVILVGLGLAFMFNFQLLGALEELIFQLTYIATGRYSNISIIVAGFFMLLVGMVLMIYGTRKVIHSVVSAIIPDKSGSLMDTIFMQRKLTQGPAITVVGGGTGLSTMLRGIKYITHNVTAVVTTADNGGSSGRLRKELGIIPPGDLRNCLTALAEREPLMERIMQYRFTGDSSLAGHCFGNLFIAAMAQAQGGMEEGLAATSQILKVRGSVVPSTLEDIQLQAKMTDGTVITGESEIPEARKTIEQLYMLPADAPASQAAVEAIRKADVLIFGPGSLYTSVIPNLLVKGIRDAVVESEAVKIYICNVMTQPGETDGYGAYEHVKAIIDHVGTQFLDYVIVNKQAISRQRLDMYDAQGSVPVTPDIQKLKALGISVVPANIISKENKVRHDPKRLARVIIGLIYHLRLLGAGRWTQFFDYIFLRHGMRSMK